MEIEDQPSSNKYQFIELVQRERESSSDTCPGNSNGNSICYKMILSLRYCVELDSTSIMVAGRFSSCTCTASLSKSHPTLQS